MTRPPPFFLTHRRRPCPGAAPTRAHAAAPRRRYSSYFVNGKSVPDIWSWLRKNYWAFPKGLFWSSVYVWIPIQVVNLYWVPLPFRVLYMNVSVMVRSLPCPAHPPSPQPPRPRAPSRTQPECRRCGRCI